MSMSRGPSVVILSGGQEVVSIAIAEALVAAGVPYRVIALRPNSLLRGLPGCMGVADFSRFSSCPDAMRERLVNELADCSARAGKRVVVFATEDGGLRCMNEFVKDVLTYAEFSRARALGMGGLDKAELFQALSSSDASDIVPRTVVLDDVEQVPDAMDALGVDAIFKPALKPWDMDLGLMSGKVVGKGAEDEDFASVVRRIRKAWPLSSRWVAQERLSMFEDGERGSWLVGNGVDYEGISFVERWKHPRQGGTACLVDAYSATAETKDPAVRILSAIDFVGLAEVPFLVGKDGRPKLLEINTRAWLQVGLAEACGFNVVTGSISALETQSCPSPVDAIPRSWVHVERAILAILGGSTAGRFRSALELMATVRGDSVIAAYSCRLPHVRRRWLLRNLEGFRSMLRRRA